MASTLHSILTEDFVEGKEVALLQLLPNTFVLRDFFIVIVHETMPFGAPAFQSREFPITCFIPIYTLTVLFVDHRLPTEYRLTLRMSAEGY